MTKKILVAYATRGSSTTGVAEAIGQTLRNMGFQADVQLMENVKDVTVYDAVVAGSAIRFDRWLPEAMDFMHAHQHNLAQRPFAAFLVCLAMAAQKPQRLERSKVYAANRLVPVRTLVSPVSEGLFAGVLNLKKLPFIWRVLFRIPLLLGLFKQGDYRDWDAINQWAVDLPEKLFTALSPLPTNETIQVMS